MKAIITILVILALGYFGWQMLADDDEGTAVAPGSTSEEFENVPPSPPAPGEEAPESAMGEMMEEGKEMMEKGEEMMDDAAHESGEMLEEAGEMMKGEVKMEAEAEAKAE